MQLRRFWQVLADLSGHGQVLEQWREDLGDEFEKTRRFLQPTDELATAYPCPRPGGEGCPREVIHHSENHIVAACRDVPPSCDLVRLTKADLILYEIDVRSLCQEIAKVLGLGGQPIQEKRRAWSLGLLHSSQRGPLPVWLVFSAGGSNLSDEVLSILGRIPGPFLFLTPRAASLSTDLRALLLTKGGDVSGLDAALTIDAQGFLTQTRSFESILWPSPPRQGDGELPEALIRKVGRQWEFTYQGKSIVLPNWIGVRYLVELLRGRKEPIPVRQLFAAVKGVDPQTLHADGLSQDTDLESDREELRKLRGQRAQAEAESNILWLKEIDEGVAFLKKKLSSQTDLRGRRRPDDPGETCRKNVSKAFHRALGEIRRLHPELADHLDAVSIGFQCWYHPQKPVDWQFR